MMSAADEKKIIHLTEPCHLVRDIRFSPVIVHAGWCVWVFHEKTLKTSVFFHNSTEKQVWCGRKGAFLFFLFSIFFIFLWKTDNNSMGLVFLSTTRKCL